MHVEWVKLVQSASGSSQADQLHPNGLFLREGRKRANEDPSCKHGESSRAGLRGRQQLHLLNVRSDAQAGLVSTADQLIVNA